MRQVRAPLFPTVSPQSLDGLLTTYPLTTRQSLDGFREYGNAINAAHEAAYFGGGQNELVNGNFFLNQRLVASLGAGTGLRRMSDVWGHWSVGSTYTASLENFVFGQTEVPYEPRLFNRVNVTSVAGANNLCYLYAPLQGRTTDYAQRRVSVTWWARADAARPMSVEMWRIFGSGGSADETFGGQQFQLTTVWQKFQAYVDIPALTGKTIGNEADCNGLSFWFDAGSNWSVESGNIGQQSGTFDISDVVVCIGDVETVKRRPYAQEMLLSHRTFFRAGGLDLYQSFGFGLVLGTNVGYFSYFLPTPMRTTPALTVNNLANFAITDSSGATVTPTGITCVDVIGTTQCATTIIATGVGIANGAAFLSANNSLAASLDFSAEV